MDLAQLANLGEFIGGVAVLVTLIYLALQIRQSNQNDRLDALQKGLVNYSNHSAIVARDENVGAFVKGLNAYESLGPEERVKFNMCVTGYLNVVEMTKAHTETGKLNEVIDAVDPYFGPRLFAYPGFRDWWSHTKKAGFLPETVTWVDQQIDEHRSAKGFWERASS